MKRLISVLMALSLCMAVTACGGGQSGTDGTADTAADGTVAEEAAAEEDGTSAALSAEQEISEAGLAAEAQAMEETPVDFDPEGHYLSDDLGPASLDLTGAASVEPAVQAADGTVAGAAGDPAAEAAPAVDPNSYFINIGIDRLISMSGTAEYSAGGVMHFTAAADVDPDAAIIGDIYGRPDHVTVVIADSQWKYLDSGTVLNFYKQIDPVPEEVPAE